MKSDILIFIIGKLLLITNYIITNYISENYNIISCNDDFYKVVKLLCIVIILPIIIMFVVAIIYTKIISNYRIINSEFVYYNKLSLLPILENVIFSMFVISYHEFKLGECDQNSHGVLAMIWLSLTIILIMGEIFMIIYYRYRETKIEFNDKYYDV